MIFILDHISSVMVYGALAFIVASTQLRAQQTTIQQTIVYASKKQTLEFADLVEREFKLMGSGIEDRDDMIASLEKDANGNATSFSFRYLDVSDVEHLVEYRLTESRAVRMNGGDVQLYKLTRYDNGAESGGGPSTVRRFQIQMLTGAGGATNDRTAAELIRVTFTNCLPMGDLDDFFIPETNWAATMRPMNLAS